VPAAAPIVRPSFARSAATSYGAQIAAAVLSLANVLITARALGAHGRGEIAFLTTVAFFSSQFATLGLPQSIVNFASSDPSLSRTLAANAVVLSLVLGGAMAAIVALIVAVVPAAGGESADWLRWLVLASLPMLVLQLCLQMLAQAHYRFRATNLAWLLGPLVNVSVAATLGLLGALSVAAAVGAWLAGQALGTALLVYTIVRRTGGFGSPDGPLARRMLAFGVKAHLGRTMLVGNYRLDQWILGGVAGARELGTYSVAVAWSETLFFLPTTLATVQRPDLVRAGAEAARKQATRVFRVAILLTLPVALGLMVFAPVLCVSVFGESFRASIPQTRILALGALGIVALKLLANALTAQRMPLRETAAIAVAFGTIVVLDVLLIPSHGALGAAWASTVAYTVGGIAALILFSRALPGPAGELVPRPRDIQLLRGGIE
jgi:O-antigen/teichoic acid export membrane protein